MSCFEEFREFDEGLEFFLSDVEAWVGAHSILIRGLSYGQVLITEDRTYFSQIPCDVDGFLFMGRPIDAFQDFIQLD